MKQVVCNECGAVLIETESESPVKIGIEVQQHGFVYKNACLFSDKYRSLYFCNDECCKNFYLTNIPKNEKNIAIQKALEETKKEIPRMAKECANSLASLTEFLKSKNIIQ